MFEGLVSMLEFIRKICGEQNGSVSLTVAIFMVVLIGIAGFVMDMGARYSEGVRLQNSLDSAVLAASQELPANNTSSSAWAATESEALNYASLNGFDITADDLEPVYKNGKIIGISALETVSVEYNFIKVLGIDSGSVTRTASAGLSPVGGVGGAVPLCITDSGLRSAIEAGAVRGLIIKCSTDSSLVGIDSSTLHGWFGAVRFDGSGASNYSNLLANGYSSVLTIGQVLDMENGNMSGPTMDGFTTRVSKCTDGCTPDNYLPGCPRVVYLPVVQVLPSKQVKIISFAAFFLEECGGNGNNSYIKASYLNGVSVPDAASGVSGQDFGLYVNKLLS